MTRHRRENLLHPSEVFRLAEEEEKSLPKDFRSKRMREEEEEEKEIRVH